MVAPFQISTADSEALLLAPSGRSSCHSADSPERATRRPSAVRRITENVEREASGRWPMVFESQASECPAAESGLQRTFSFPLTRMESASSRDQMLPAP